MLNKNYNISAESFFSPLPEDFLPIEKDFVPFDQSVVWYFNELFWQNTKLWEKTYGQHYEKSLPEGLSTSHRPEFINQSVDHFLLIIDRLKRENMLPEKIFILEQGAGSGIYALGFLNSLEQKYPVLYQSLSYVISDTSLEILKICRRILKKHQKQTVFYQQKSTYDLPKLQGNKFLFVRHGNFWDQLPCKIFQKKPGEIFEIYTKALLTKNLEKDLVKTNTSLVDLVKIIRQKRLISFLKKYPHLWKPLIQNLKLQTEVTNNMLKEKIYEELPEETFIINSLGVLKNLESYLPLIDWDNGAYLEVVDIIFPKVSSFSSERLPKKYDGALGVGVNGPEIKIFLKNKNLFFSQKSIKGINSRVRIFKYDLKSLLLHRHFFSIAEIAARKEQTIQELKDKTEKLFALGTDLIAFSDQAGAGEQFYPMEELSSSALFSQINGGAVMTNIAVRRKTKETLLRLFSDLKKSGVKNIFVLAGDPGTNDSSDKVTWEEVIPLATKDFFVGAVAHPEVSDVKNSEEKYRLGADFLIVQACYNNQQWSLWLEEIKKKKLYEKIPLIPVIIPITSKKMLSVIDSLPDVAISEKVKNDFLSLESDEKIKEKGIELAKRLLKDYRGEGIFSGVYLYSKSEEVVKKILE
ncbi:SAM-dependent methyltransferase [Candidatus Microgenomates bacterium]|nr:SAM-dependent methyltransferase [Candidatus Microgenomates bacterium]